MQQDAMILCGLLRSGATKARNGVNGNCSAAQDADDVLEHAALRLWKALQRRGDRGAAVDALLYVDRKAWNRIARLLFASSSSVVHTVVAVMHALASSPPLVSVRDSYARAGGDEHGGAGDDAVETSERESLQSIHERIWRSEWWQHIVTKSEDCYSSACVPQRSMSSEERNKDVEICVRLLQVVEVVLRHQGSFICTADGRAGREKEDHARMDECVALFVSLCTSPVHRVAICASTSLLSILQGSGEPSAVTASKLFSDSMVTVECIAKWLRDSGVSSESPSQRTSSSVKTKHETSENLQLQCVYFDLLVFAASSPSTEHIKWLVLDKVNPLQLSTQFLSHPHAKLQEKALDLLTATLLHSSSSAHQAKSSAVCSNIRISGLLITICWITGHSHSSVVQAAGRLIYAVIASSPAADILRALIEQGCALILSALVSTAPESRESHQDQDQIQETGQSNRVLDWMATEIVSEQVVGAAVSSVLRSSNVLLQKNVILSLLLLSQRDTELKELLDDEENFLDEVVQVAIDANEDGSLAAMLLAAVLSWCDKCSVLKLEDSGGSFRLSKSGKSLHVATAEAKVSSKISPVIKLIHSNDAILAEVDGVVLYNLSKLVRKWVETMPSEPQILLNQFQASTIQMFADVLPKSQQEAVVILKHKDFPDLSELLELAKYLECSKCWHFATFAMNHTLSHSNWVSVFEFALKIRHPSLILRAGNMALECFEDETKDGNNVDQTPASSSGNTPMRRFPELKTAAFQMFREVFQAEAKPKRDPERLMECPLEQSVTGEL